MEQQMSALDTKLEDLEGENDNLKSEKSEMGIFLTLSNLTFHHF
jgi:hypothetical protein